MSYRFVGLWKSLFLIFLLLARDALVALLREHGKDQQAVDLAACQLTKLCLDDCQIGDDGAEIVADFIKHDETVKTVWLYSCNIRSRGVSAIAESLKHNTSVDDIEIGHHLLGNEGAEALIDALNNNVCIRNLSWSVNHIAPEASGLIGSIVYLAETRNAVLIPEAVRRAALFLIASRSRFVDVSDFAIFPKEIVKLIAMEVWASRKDPIWVQAVTDARGIAHQNAWIDQWARDNDFNRLWIQIQIE